MAEANNKGLLSKNVRYKSGNACSQFIRKMNYQKAEWEFAKKIKIVVDLSSDELQEKYQSKEFI